MIVRKTAYNGAIDVYERRNGKLRLIAVERARRPTNERRREVNMQEDHLIFTLGRAWKQHASAGRGSKRETTKVEVYYTGCTPQHALSRWLSHHRPDNPYLIEAMNLLMWVDNDWHSYRSTLLVSIGDEHREIYATVIRRDEKGKYYPGEEPRPEPRMQRVFRERQTLAVLMAKELIDVLSRKEGLSRDGKKEASQRQR